MRFHCRRLEKLIQSQLDAIPGDELEARDVEHLASCPSCRELVSGYPRFARELASRASQAVTSLGEPDWQAILSRAGLSAASGADVGERVRSRKRLPPLRSSLLAAAAAVVVLGGALLLGYHHYQASSASRFVRADTTAFVDAMFASSIFSAATPQTGPAAIGSDSGWFEATSLSSQLPLPPAASEGTGTPAAGQAGR